MNLGFESSRSMSENLNLSSSRTFPRPLLMPFSLSKRASIATNSAQSSTPTSISMSPRVAGAAVSRRVYISPWAFCATRTGESMKAAAVPSLATATCAPIAKATFPPLYHFAMERVTATPAISLPRPKSIQPAYAMVREVEAGSPLLRAKSTVPAPTAIKATNTEPTILTPNMSSRMPQTISPPQTQRKL